MSLCLIDFVQTRQCLVAGSRDKSIISQSVTQTLTRREVPQETPALLFPTGSDRLAVQKNMTQCRLYPQNPNYVLP